MATPPARSQTLDRGLTLLETVAAAGHPVTITELVTATGLHRSIVYRLVRTLEDHRLLARDTGDTYRLGFGLAALARGLTNDLARAATPHLQALADHTDLAAFIVVREADDAVTILVVEPSTPGTMFTQRIGYRHPVTSGAPGHALRTLQPPHPDEPAALTAFRERGWAESHSEVLDGVSSVAAPLPGYRLPAALAVTYVGERDVAHLVAAVTSAQRAILALM